MPRSKRGSPFLNKNGRWEIEGSHCGERYHRVLPKGKTKKDASALQEQIRRAIFNERELGRVPEIPLDQAIVRYLEEYQGKARPDSQAKALGPFVRGRQLGSVVEVAKAVSGSLQPAVTCSTKNRRLAILRRVASLAYRRWGWLKEPLHQKIEMLPENPSRNVYLSRGELAALLKGVAHRDMRKAALILAFTGLRKGELMGLKPHDVRGGTICLTETKTGRPRNVPIVPHIRFALKRLPLKFNEYSLSHAVNRASGGKVRVHDLRHTCASLLINEGVDLYVVGAILGHSKASTTQRYAHLATHTLEAAVLKLEPKRIRKPTEVSRAA